MAKRELTGKSSIESPYTSHRDREREEKVIPHVLTKGKAEVRKKTEAQKLAKLFMPKDVTDLKRWLLSDVMIPNGKRFLLDVITKLLYPDGTGMHKPGTTLLRGVGYSSIFDNTVNKTTKKNSVYDFDYDELTFNDAETARMIIDAMQDVISQYGCVSIADMYEMAQVSANNPNLHNYGWTDIRGASAIPIRSGKYVVRLPAAKPLDQ